MENVRQLINAKKPVKWVFCGDSITQGCYHTFGYSDFTELFTERVKFELGRSLDIIINTGISGNTSYDLIEQFEWRVSQFNPDVVFIMTGSNDSNIANKVSCDVFKENLMKLIEAVRSLSGHVILQTPCVVHSIINRLDFKRLEKYNNIIREICKQQKVSIIDHCMWWLKNKDKSILWMNDEIHPNQYGHRVLANYIYECLSINEDIHPTKSLYVP